MSPRQKTCRFDCANAIICRVSGATLIKEARRRSGLSQRELASRAGRKQSTIARWESGVMSPSFDAVVEVVRACGLDVELGLTRLDASYGPLIEQQLARSPLERLRHLSGFPLRRLVEALRDEDVRYLVAGPVAAVLRGSPVGPGDRVVLVPDPGPRSRMRLHRALATVASRRPTGTLGSDAETWIMRDEPGEIEVELQPPGSRGFSDLTKDATEVPVGDDLNVRIASVLDLARIADASGAADDRVQLPALRALLQPIAPPADPLAAWRGAA